MRLDHLLSREFLFGMQAEECLCFGDDFGRVVGFCFFRLLFGGWGGVFGFWIVDASIFVVVVGICDIGGKL